VAAHSTLLRAGTVGPYRAHALVGGDSIADHVSPLPVRDHQAGLPSPQGRARTVRPLPSPVHRAQL